MLHCSTVRFRERDLRRADKMFFLTCSSPVVQVDLVERGSLYALIDLGCIICSSTRLPFIMSPLIVLFHLQVRIL